MQTGAQVLSTLADYVNRPAGHWSLEQQAVSVLSSGGLRRARLRFCGTTKHLSGSPMMLPKCGRPACSGQCGGHIACG